MFQRVASRRGGLLGTWVKLPTFETLQLLGHAGFDFVVIDMEHAPLGLDRACELVLAAQGSGMAALVRLPDHSGTTIQPLLDGGADGLLIPRVTSPDLANTLTRKMVFAPEGERGLGFTSRAGLWGLGDIPGYLERGDSHCLRMVQLEDWSTLEAAADFACLPHVNGVFVGLGDLFLSSGKPSGDPLVKALVRRTVEAARARQVMCGIAASSADEARAYLEIGFSMVMVSNDTTIFGRGAVDLVRDTRKGLA